MVKQLTVEHAGGIAMTDHTQSACVWSDIEDWRNGMAPEYVSNSTIATDENSLKDLIDALQSGDLDD